MRFRILITIIILFQAQGVYTQNKPDVFKFGIQYNPFISLDEFSSEKRIKISWLVRGVMRIGLDDYLNAETGIGYGEYQGLDYLNSLYSSIIVPMDLRLHFKLIKNDTHPYFYLGGGVMYYEVDKYPAVISEEPVKNKGYAAIAPAGFGYQFRIAYYLSADIQTGIILTSSDNLNFNKINPFPDAMYNIGLSLIFGAGGPSDQDGDGLMSDVEEEIGTDPDNADTDGDGLNDGDEYLKILTNPLSRDTDNDNLPDGDEVNKYKSNPLSSDTDKDKLSDFDELNEYRTDMLKEDTDSDRLNDYLEVRIHKTDPLKKDTDGDTIDDFEEVSKTFTNPLKYDTDDDKLNDGDEVKKFKTDPLKSDTDYDALSDHDEVIVHKTDPTKQDTDGGTVNDGTEVNRGTDPLNPDDDVIQVGKPVILKGITFEFNSADINPSSEKTLIHALETLQDNPGMIVEIAGHADDIGSDQYNKELSVRRAEAVKKWLTDRGIKNERILTKGYGKDRPLVPNTTPENRHLNRRIEFNRIK